MAHYVELKVTVLISEEETSLTEAELGKLAVSEIHSAIHTFENEIGFDCEPSIELDDVELLAISEA